MLLIGWPAVGLHFTLFRGSLTALPYINHSNGAVVTLTTVGYGDIVPATNIETIYSMIVMIFGVGIYGYVIGNVANILSTWNLL